MGATIERPIFVDALIIAAITLASALPYLPHLGFYSDDWGIVAAFSADQSGWAADTITSVFRARPTQGIYLALLFKMFGLWPLGYHLVNSLVLALTCALFFLLLVRLRFERAHSFAAALLFVMLPQLSTVRVWYAASQIPLSLALTLTSMHCLLSFARHRKTTWLAGSILAAVLSVGAYEIFAPLLVGFALVLGYVTMRTTRTPRSRRIAVAALVIVGSVFVGAIYKASFSSRTGNMLDPSRYSSGLRQLFRLDYDWRVDSSLNIVATPATHFWKPVEGWWAGLQMLVRGDAGLSVTVLAMAIAALGWWRLSRADPTAVLPAGKRFVWTGAAAFLLGNATFLVIPAVVFASTGIGNRVHVAAALGVAILFSAALSFLANAASRRRPGLVFNILVLAVTASAFVRLATIEKYWAEAPEVQSRILSNARADLRGLSANSTIILDGVCPYHGPAIIFETYWDVGGALTLTLGRPLAGDVVSPRMHLTRHGIISSIYGESRFYPYGHQLYVYNPRRRELHRLPDAQAAAQYFSQRKVLPCAGYVARGAEV